MKDQQKVIDISSNTIFKIVLIIVGLIALWVIKPVLLMLFIAFIFSAAFKPYVDFLEKYKIPRLLSTILIFIVFFVIVGIGLLTVVNEALIQLKALIEQIPNTIYSIISSAESVFPIISQYVDPEVIKSTLIDFAKNIINVGPGFLSNGVTGAFEVLNNTITVFFSGLMIIIMSTYMITRKENVYDGLLMMINKDKRKGYRELLSKIQIKLGDWLRTELFIMLIVGLIVWLGLILPGIFVAEYPIASYALPIAFLAMLLEIVPGTGVGVAGILSVVIAIGFNQPGLAIYFAVFAVLVSQLETSILIPSIMKKVVGVDPILTIAGFVALYILFGIIGAILVVPIMIVLQFVVDFGVDGVIDQA